MVVVFWCVASAPIDTFNPHQLNAVEKFVAANPDTCHASPPEEVEGPKTVAECEARAITEYMPGWLPKNEGKLYLTARCFQRKYEPLDLEAMKQRVSP